MKTAELEKINREALDFVEWLLYEDGDAPYHGNIVLHINSSEIVIVEPDRKYRQKEWRKLDQDN